MRDASPRKGFFHFRRQQAGRRQKTPFYDAKLSNVHKNFIIFLLTMIAKQCILWVPSAGGECAFSPAGDGGSRRESGTPRREVLRAAKSAGPMEKNRQKNAGGLSDSRAAEKGVRGMLMEKGNDVEINDIKVRDFAKAVSECTGSVFMVTPEGDRLNLKSKLSQLIGFAALVEGGTVTHARVECTNKEDEARLFRLNLFGVRNLEK